jgi:hypothetical protein
MPQDDLVIANQTFPATRSDINANLQALGTLMSGASAPGTIYAYMYWADTTNGVLKQRNAASDAWVIRATLSDDRVVTKTTAYTVALGDYDKLILCSASGAAFTVTLPAAATAGDGFRVSLKKTDSSVNAVTIDGNASETIDGALTVAMGNQYDAFDLICDGSNWHIDNNGTFSVTRAEQTIASATTTDLGSKLTNLQAISGTTTITGFGSSASLANPVYFIRFTGALTLTHNATSLIIPGGANIVTVDGDTAVVQYLGSGNWRVRSYQRSGGRTLSMTGATVAVASAGTCDIGAAASNLVNITGTTTITSLGSTAVTANPIYFVRFTGALTLTHNGTSLILPGNANITTAAGDAGVFEYLGSGNWRCLSFTIAANAPGGGASAFLTAVSYATNTTFSTAFPADDTIPQNTEGAEMFNQSFTPANASSKIRIDWNVWGGVSGGATQYLAAGLFKDSTANALAATGTLGTGGSNTVFLGGSYTETAGSTSARAYKLRVGCQTGSFYPNGTGGATRLYGGVGINTFNILEIKP